MIREHALSRFQIEAVITGSELDVRREFEDYSDRYLVFGYDACVQETPHEVAPGEWRAVITRFHSCD